MSTKKDCERALKFVVGQRVATNIIMPNGNRMPSGLGQKAYGTITKILRTPNLQTRDSGEYEINWTDMGSSLALDAGFWPPKVLPGNKLRFNT